MGASLSYPGMLFKNLCLREWKRAPSVGEDNEKIYGGTLGLSGEEIKRLARLGVI
jgi:crotonobetainyl-CoA:carnitine CoA-transferase CaiB-like acyl-CoA transferase